MNYSIVKWFALLLTILVTPAVRAADYRVDFDAVPKSHYLDRWMYPFNATPGSRVQAPTFGAVDSQGFDDRDGQFLMAINTSLAGIPAGQAAAQYRIESARLTLSEIAGGYAFDATYDNHQTYLALLAPNYQNDNDAGHPIELYGAGFRGGYDEFGWPDGQLSTASPVFSAGSPFGVRGRGTRNVFAADAAGRDVSNNVDSLNLGQNGFDPTPFAVGQASYGGAALTAGADVAPGATFTFEIDTSDAAIQAYLQNALSVGQLGLVVSSLHSTGQMGEGEPFPNLATSDHFAIAGPVFEIRLTIDEPLAGDLNGDRLLTAVDIDALADVIVAGTHAAGFDLDGNQLVDPRDHRRWVEELFGTFFGDANLDRQFDSADLVEVFGAGQYEDALPANSGWSTGDWDGNQEFDSGDLVAAFQSGSYDNGPRQAAAIPEPLSVQLSAMGLVLAAAVRRRTRHTCSAGTGRPARCR